MMGAAALALAAAPTCFAKTGASDETFLKNASEANAAELKAASMAQDKGQSAAVKEFASRMLRDHQAATEDLKRVADKLKVSTPGEPSPQHQQEAERLSKLSGTEFDQAYIRAMQKDHRKVVKMFQEASNSSNPDVKELAQKLLPTLQEHLAMAEKMSAGH